MLELSRNRIVARAGAASSAATPSTRPAAEISFAEVIRVVDGPLALAPCVSPRLGLRKCDDCPDLAACTLREALALGPATPPLRSWRATAWPTR